MSVKAKGKANKLDEHLGQQLRIRRNMLGMSQEKLAELLGLTFQQVQKYERGKNRISASRLYDLARILDVSVDYFYKDATEAALSSSARPGFAEDDQDSFIDDSKLTSKETLDLIRIYYSIEDPKLRKNLFNFMKSMAENLKSEEKSS